MIVWHFGGEVECKSLAELNSVLKVRYGNGINEFLIYGDKAYGDKEHGEKEYPYLAILVNNDYAFMTFFPRKEEENSVFQSVGLDTKLDQNEMSTFYTGTPTEIIEVWNEFVVPFSKANEAAIEFFTSLSLPTCLEWSKQ